MLKIINWALVGMLVASSTTGALAQANETRARMCLMLDEKTQQLDQEMARAGFDGQDIQVAQLCVAGSMLAGRDLRATTSGGCYLGGCSLSNAMKGCLPKSALVVRIVEIMLNKEDFRCI